MKTRIYAAPAVKGLMYSPKMTPYTPRMAPKLHPPFILCGSLTYRNGCH